MTDHSLDEFDRKLLEILYKDSRLKNTEIARKLNVTEGAIRKRIKKLMDSGYIEKFTIKLNEKKFSGTWAIVQIQIAGDSKPSIIRDEIVSRINGVEEIYETAGDVDIIAIFNTSGDQTLKSAIEEMRSVDGVVNTKTYISLNRTKIHQELPF